MWDVPVYISAYVHAHVPVSISAYVYVHVHVHVHVPTYGSCDISHHPWMHHVCMCVMCICMRLADHISCMRAWVRMCML